MVQFAPRVFSLAVVREHAPAYGLTSDGLPAVDETAGADADVIEALGDEIATLAARQRFALLTPRGRPPAPRPPR
jgi:hypothetical protein